MYRSILVPLDMSSEADRALPIANALARRIGARLDVVSVTSAGIDVSHDIGEVQWHAQAMGVEVGGVHIRHDDDVAGGVLAETASDDALLCCATHARGRWGELLFQNASAGIIRRSTRPVLLVGPGTDIAAPARFTEVLACVDGSAATPDVASTAAMWGRLLETKVHVIGVVDDQHPDDTSSAWPPPERIASTLNDLGIDTTWDLIDSADPAQAIVSYARQLGSPLLVMGAHGHTDVEHPALGHVSLAVLRHSPHPVLVVPTHPAPS